MQPACCTLSFCKQVKRHVQPLASCPQPCHTALQGLGGVTNTSTPVVMSSMQGADVTLVVTKNPGLEMADILDSEGSADGGSAAAWLKHLTGWGDSSAGSGVGRTLSCTWL